MQIYALSAGSPSAGAFSMMVFGLGTFPLMFGLGSLSTIMSRKFTSKVMTAGAALVVVLGVSVTLQGLPLQSGKFIGLEQLPVAQNSSEDTNPTAQNDVQSVNSSIYRGRYPAITVKVGVPVKWTITAPKGSINGCNHILQIPKLGIQKQLETGDNVIEFTPSETGKIPYSCWMGMIRSSITVVQ
jgi:plastocyanin domain-containing protein